LPCQLNWRFAIPHSVKIEKTLKIRATQVLPGFSRLTS
jgi:hypothetical protein